MKCAFSDCMVTEVIVATLRGRKGGQAKLPHRHTGRNSFTPSSSLSTALSLSLNQPVAMETECKTLWMGDIQMHWDEAFIASLFASAGASKLHLELE